MKFPEVPFSSKIVQSGENSKYFVEFSILLSELMFKKRLDNDSCRSQGLPVFAKRAECKIYYLEFMRRRQSQSIPCDCTSAFPSNATPLFKMKECLPEPG